MARQFINQLQARAQVREVYRVSDKQLRTNRQGNLYLLLQLADKTGNLSAMRWNANQELYESLQRGDYLWVEGTTQLFNGNIQLIVTDFRVAAANQVDPTDFEAVDIQQIEHLKGELSNRLTSLQNPDLRRLADLFLSDEDLIAQFMAAPAGVKTHHAYPGGLLQHVVDLMNLADAVAPCYPQVDRELLIMGVFLHDIGKVEELAFDNEMVYSDPGQMIGHLVQGVQILDRKTQQLATQGTPLPSELVWRLQHMIVSHHGCLEHGSPKVPMTLEALVLHYIDDLDAKMNAATELIRSDKNSDSPWTNFNPTLGRKLYKPSDAQNPPV